MDTHLWLFGEQCVPSPFLNWQRFFIFQKYIAFPFCISTGNPFLLKNKPTTAGIIEYLITEFFVRNTLQEKH